MCSFMKELNREFNIKIEVQNFRNCINKFLQSHKLKITI